MEAENQIIKSKEELSNLLLNNNHEKYNYLYIAGYGNENCVGDNNDNFIIEWEEIGSILCEVDCLEEDVYQLFASCPKIQYVCGARQSMYNIDLVIFYIILNQDISTQY